jgi:hypothetical protein
MDKALKEQRTWSCQVHPGCMFSIPCECKNCMDFDIALAFQASQEYQSPQESVHKAQKVAAGSQEEQLKPDLRGNRYRPRVQWRQLLVDRKE